MVDIGAVLLGAIVGYAIGMVLVSLWFWKGLGLVCRLRGHDWTDNHYYQREEPARADGRAFCWREAKYVMKGQR